MMLQCPHFSENHDTAAMAPADVTVLEWQIARLEWLQQQHHQSYFAATPTSLDLHPDLFSILPAGTAGSHTCSTFGDEEGSVAHDLSSNMSLDLIRRAILGSSFASGGKGTLVAGDVPILRTFNCPPELSDVEMKVTPSAPHAPLDRGGTDGGRQSTRKRKAAHLTSTQEQEDDMDERTVGDACYTGAFMEPKLETPPISCTTTTATTIVDGKDSNPTSNKEASSDTSRENYSKVSEQPPKTDYIHVRARRGQATDSHSLAERVRREKISKRMKLLQDLVPGCNKITGKAGVLDEIINYVQSLQRQVEFLSMKLAAVSPTLDAFFSKEMIPHCGGMAPSLMGMPPPELLDASFLAHVNTMQTQQQAGAAAAALKGSSIDVAVSTSCSEEQATLLRRTTAGEPVLMSEHCAAMDSHKVRGLAPTSPWEAALYGGHYSAYESQQGLERGALPCATSSNFPMLTTPRP